MSSLRRKKENLLGESKFAKNVRKFGGALHVIEHERCFAARRCDNLLMRDLDALRALFEADVRFARA